MSTTEPTLTAADVTSEQLAGTIDHSLLKPELTVADVAEGCAVADRYRVASVCVRPADVPRATASLAQSPVMVGTVIGFPHGSTSTAAKVAEARQALGDGAVELDMVQAIGLLRSGEDGLVEADIRAVVETAHESGAIVKVILETAYLDEEQKRRACRLAEAAGADFVKTSTGHAPGGATPEDVRLMRESVSPRVQVKAAGGVRTLDAALQMMALGVTRIGATATAAILDEHRERTGA